MSLRIFNGEKFDRSKVRYVFFTIIILGIITLSLYKKNIVGVVVLFFILGAYIYYSIIANQTTRMTIHQTHLLVDKKSFPRKEFKGYVIEIEKTSKNIKNLVLLTTKGHIIYTINDTNENIKTFLRELEEYIPMESEYTQSVGEKITRLLQL